MHILLMTGVITTSQGMFYNLFILIIHHYVDISDVHVVGFQLTRCGCIWFQLN